MFNRYLKPITNKFGSCESEWLIIYLISVACAKHDKFESFDNSR